jgi:hypothetical protein
LRIQKYFDGTGNHQNTPRPNPKLLESGNEYHEDELELNMEDSSTFLCETKHFNTSPDSDVS